MMGHVADLWNHVATKYGRSDMGDRWQKVFFAKGRSCQNSATAVGNYTCRATMGHNANLPTHVAGKYGCKLQKRRCFFFF